MRCRESKKSSNTIISRHCLYIDIKYRMQAQKMLKGIKKARRKYISSKEKEDMKIFEQLTFFICSVSYESKQKEDKIS